MLENEELINAVILNLFSSSIKCCLTARLNALWSFKIWVCNGNGYQADPDIFVTETGYFMAYWTGIAFPSSLLFACLFGLVRLVYLCVCFVCFVLFVLFVRLFVRFVCVFWFGLLVCLFVCFVRFCVLFVCLLLPFPGKVWQKYGNSAGTHAYTPPIIVVESRHVWTRGLAEFFTEEFTNLTPSRDGWNLDECNKAYFSGRQREPPGEVTVPGCTLRVEFSNLPESLFPS